VHFSSADEEGWSINETSLDPSPDSSIFESGLSSFVSSDFASTIANPQSDRNCDGNESMPSNMERPSMTTAL
jgi:hypothetical protein